MNGPGPKRKKRRTRERGRTHGKDVADAVYFVVDTLDWICAGRLKPVPGSTAVHLAKFDEMQVSEHLLEQLETISVSTLRRILKRFTRPLPTIPQQRRGRPPDSVVQAMVPQGKIPWNEPEPGHLGVDHVIHGAPRKGRKVVSTCHFVDVLIGWSERFTVYGHESADVWPMFLDFERCPIPVREIHSDNGSGLLNQATISHHYHLGDNIRVSRNRPGYKNDNRIVEQKNSSLVRAYLGQLRFDSPAHCQALNELYDTMWLYCNFFQPVLRQISRRAVRGANGTVRIVRKHDQAATPLNRLLRAKPPISSTTADELLALYHDIHPRQLRNAIHQQLMMLREIAREPEALSIQVCRQGYHLEVISASVWLSFDWTRHLQGAGDLTRPGALPRLSVCTPFLPVLYSRHRIPPTPQDLRHARQRAIHNPARQALPARGDDRGRRRQLCAVLGQRRLGAALAL